MDSDRAERAVLGSVLQDATAWSLVSALPSDYFSTDYHRRIRTAMSRLATAGRVIDAYTVAQQLEADYGPDARLLAHLSDVMSEGLYLSNIETYIADVRRAAGNRYAAHAIEALGKATNDASIEELAERFVEIGQRVADFADGASSTSWRSLFKSRSEMEQGELPFLIDGILPEGIGFIGAPSFTGKTYFALSMAKALTTGKPLLGRWSVLEVVFVLYLIPEAGEKSFRARLDRMGIPDDRFLCRTVKDGVLKLDDRRLLAAVRELRPVVFLDTAIRFSTAKDENSATENRALMDAFCGLINAGARAVVGIHHSAKSTATAEELTLENTLRGTGDLGAMADVVYGLKSIDRDTTEIMVVCVKHRDFDCPAPFHITGRPYINEMGDFVITTEPGELTGSAAQRRDDITAVAEAIANEPGISQNRLIEKLGMRRQTATDLLRDNAGKFWRVESGERGKRCFYPISTGSRTGSRVQQAGTGPLVVPTLIPTVRNQWEPPLVPNQPNKGLGTGNHLAGTEVEL